MSFQRTWMKQKQFIDEYLIRGRKTVFANVLAKGKAGGVGETEIEKVANQWELQDFIDAGPSWRENPKLFCEMWSCTEVSIYRFKQGNEGA